MINVNIIIVENNQTKLDFSNWISYTLECACCLGKKRRKKEIYRLNTEYIDTYIIVYTCIAL